jgi:hypothetical protein
MKSSALSVSILPALACRVAVAIRSSGIPVLKKKLSAWAFAENNRPAAMDVNA